MDFKHGVRSSAARVCCFMTFSTMVVKSVGKPSTVLPQLAFRPQQHFSPRKAAPRTQPELGTRSSTWLD